VCREGRGGYQYERFARYREHVDVSPLRDRIDIDGVVVTTVVGALPHEREIAQPVQIDLSVFADLHDAGSSDELTDTVHYGLVVGTRIRGVTGLA
jgi:FolB domain-containing protein